MSKIIFSILSILGVSGQNGFNPVEFDYCKIKCNSDIHTACNCVIEAPREEVRDNIEEFRQEVLRLHNHWRNFVASGLAAETWPMVPAASNMLAMNYDLELEYIARCLAGRFEGNHDECRRTHDDVYIGQNLVGISVKNYSLVPELIKSWYDEIEYIENTRNIDIFEDVKTTKGVIGHFTQLVWSEADRVGCARVWNPELIPQAWRFTLICNYGSSNGSAGNVIGAPVYGKGEPCSACPFGTKCEDDEFTSLCGKFFGPGSTAGGQWKEEIVLILSVSFLLKLVFKNIA